MLRTGQLLGPASHPASRPRTGASLPGTLASPRTGLTPAGCPQLVDWLRHHNINLLVVMAPNLLDAPPVGRVSGTVGQGEGGSMSLMSADERLLDPKEGIAVPGGVVTIDPYRGKPS